MQCALPDAACPGLHRKPLDAAIGQLLTPYCPGGRRGDSKQNNNEKNAPTLLAILMAVAMCRFNTAHITQWRRSRASLEATGCCHLASIVANSSNWSCICCFFMFFIVKLVEKGCGLALRPPVFNRGMPYQSDGRT
jgi:hypothetical protein